MWPIKPEILVVENWFTFLWIKCVTAVLTFILQHRDYRTYLTVSFRFITNSGLFSLFYNYEPNLGNMSGKKRRWCLSFIAPKHLLLISSSLLQKQRALKTIVEAFERRKGTVQPRLWWSGTEKKTQRRRLHLRHIRERGQKIFAGGRSVDVNILGNKLVLGCGAALCGRVCMRLVPDNHFCWDA